MDANLSSLTGSPAFTPVDWRAVALGVAALGLGAIALVELARRRGFRLVAFADRVVVYGVLAGLLLSVYVGATFAITSLVPSGDSIAYEAAAACIALLVAVTYGPAGTLVQRGVDTALYRDYYDYEKTLQRFSQRLATAHEPDAVVRLLLDDLGETLNLSGVAFIPLPEGLAPGVLNVIEPDDVRARGVYATPEGRRALVAQLAALDLSSRRLPTATQLTLQPWKGCAALVYIGSAVYTADSALLVVGPKGAGGPLRREDGALLVTLANQAATALSNAQLVSGLRISLQQVELSTTQLAAARAEQELLLHALVNADERQRAALARELHDDALQEALYLVRHAQLALRLGDPARRDSVPPAGMAPGDSMSRGAPSLERVGQELRQLVERSQIIERKLRALCLGLYPDVLHSLGLPSALEDLALQVSASGQLDVTLELDESSRSTCERLEPQAALHLYRITQEALSNAYKHGHATAATVCLLIFTPTGARVSSESESAAAWLRLQIRDNGVGFSAPVDVGEALRQGHLGLASMRERAQLVGGRLALEHGPGGGAEVTAIAPLSLASRAANGERARSRPRL